MAIPPAESRIQIVSEELTSKRQDISESATAFRFGSLSRAEVVHLSQAKMYDTYDCFMHRAEQALNV